MDKLNKKEQIGKIILDYTCYPGEDYYCDGMVEDELLQIVQETPPSYYAKVIEEKGEWPVFYHLSPLRGNIVNWIPLTDSDKVLEVGAGCGAITATLAQKAGQVDCIDLSRKRSLINAYRNRQYDNVTIQVGNFKDIEPGLPCDYDYIFLIGVFEYGQSYIGGENPYEDFLDIIQKHIKQSGRIVIAIENKFGLKYWAGCREDHLGTYFSGIEDYAAGGGVRTFTRNGLERICQTNNRKDYSFYYPYPDYKFPTAIYSDKRLPKVGELSTNLCNYDRERMLLFDEKNAFDGIIRDGEFPLFANSYLLVIGPNLPLVYTKYSNDRAPEYAVRTDIIEETGAWENETKQESTTLKVRKEAMTQEACAHIKHIEEAYRKLSKRYEGSSLSVNRCELDANGSSVSLEYLSGPTLEEMLDECLDRGDEAGFERLFADFCSAVSYGEESGVTDYDLIFSNLINTGVADKKEEWSILDYEWTFDGERFLSEEELTMQEVILRALYCYSMGAWKRRKLSHELIKKISGGGEEVLERLAQKELLFQQFVTGQRMALADIRNRIGQDILPIQQLAMEQSVWQERKKIQIYPDTGFGFSEDTSYFAEDAYREKEETEGSRRMELELKLPKEWRSVRIDPAMEACMMTVHNLCLQYADRREQLTLQDRRVILNGNLISDNTILYATKDPNLTIMLPSPNGPSDTCEAQICSLYAEWVIAPLPLSVAEAAAAGAAKRRIFWKK